MILFPAIDLYQGNAVRLYKGRYQDMTVYSQTPVKVALDFLACGCDHVHLVDLEGARDGGTPNFDTVIQIKKETGLFCEIGGGIRNVETVDRYLSGGIDRVILGTAAVEDPDFLCQLVSRYGDAVAVGADVLDGTIRTKGWREHTGIGLDDFLGNMQSLGVATVICTDISKDGAMSGTNLELYRAMSQKYALNITASGGVSTLDDVRSLAGMGLYGAIIGKAYYTGAILLKQALEVAGT